MALTLVVLTEQLLDGITTQQLVAFTASIPDVDRPFWKARFPTVAMIRDYVLGVQTDRNAEGEPKVVQPLRAALIRDDGTPYALVLGRDFEDGSTKIHWVGRVNGQTLAALALTRDALKLAGRTSMFAHIPNASLRDKVGELAGMTVTGDRAEMVL